MKRCPTCNRTEVDDALAFCRNDGTRLIVDSQPIEPATMVLSTELKGSQAPTEHIQNVPSIAVLSFVNMSADQENEYFCDGLAEELLNALAKIEHLKVAARTSSFSFKGKNVNVDEIGRALHVNTVLEGSVRKSGNRLRITVQLVNATDGYHLWSERYDREMKDIFDVQDEITLAVVDALKLRMLGDEKETVLKRHHSKDSAAYQAYLKGRALLYQRGLSIPKAIECFKQAVSLDGDYAQAWAGLADGYTTSGYSGFKLPSEVMPRALEAAQRALQLDPDLAEAHNAFACATLLYDLDYDRAEQEFRRALELNPNYPQARAWYGLFLLQWIAARDQEARDQMLRLLEVDPLSGYANVILSFSSVTSGRPAEALEHARKGVELDPNSYLAHWIFAVALASNSQYEEAAAMAERALTMSGRHSWALMTLTSIYSAWHKLDNARAVYRELEARSAREYIQPSMLAPAAAAVGEMDRAIAFAQQALDDKDPLFVMLARTWPDYDRLRADSRFREIVSQLRLPDWEVSESAG
ncbi:MAG TPA: tetratricopeptide repeat protein [Pyrinomonadaceae bacterium]|nr:tetratricopeptide repeat protein [Pyrinomonadaceae bacterium]